MKKTWFSLIVSAAMVFGGWFLSNLFHASSTSGGHTFLAHARGVLSRHKPHSPSLFVTELQHLSFMYGKLLSIQIVENDKTTGSYPFSISKTSELGVDATLANAVASAYTYKKLPKLMILPLGNDLPQVRNMSLNVGSGENFYNVSTGYFNDGYYYFLANLADRPGNKTSLRLYGDWAIVYGYAFSRMMFGPKTKEFDGVPYTPISARMEHKGYRVPFVVDFGKGSQISVVTNGKKPFEVDTDEIDTPFIKISPFTIRSNSLSGLLAKWNKEIA